MLKKLLFAGLSLSAVMTAWAMVNINTASADELDKQLTGIGPAKAKAKAIVEFREKNGLFKSVDDLTKVPGIKEGTVNKLRSQATVSAPHPSSQNPKPQPVTK